MATALVHLSLPSLLRAMSLFEYYMFFFSSFFRGTFGSKAGWTSNEGGWLDWHSLSEHYRCYVSIATFVRTNDSLTILTLEKNTILQILQWGEPRPSSCAKALVKENMGAPLDRSVTP